MNKNTQTITSRPPIVAVMGHIDHGKSTLLDYIRKTNVVETESGGITQHISAYEANHKGQDGKEHRITFLDTPGHEAFSSMRSRGAHIADVAILVVSAEDGVNTQTVEAFKSITESKTPVIVAINKIDAPGANIEKTKNSLVEHSIYIEGYGGDIPAVAVSAKEGTNVPELLDMILLVSEMNTLTGDTSKNAEGVVIESHIDPKRGISATLLITDGVLKTGMCIAAGGSCSPVRAIEDFTGKRVEEASFSSPVRITGFDVVPEVGSIFTSYQTKSEAEESAKENKTRNQQIQFIGSPDADVSIPLIVKTDVAGTLEAIEKELLKVVNEKVSLKIIHKGVGDIAENDMKIASGSENPLIIGFRVKADAKARAASEKTGVQIETFAIIYNITDRVEEEVIKRTPKEEVVEEAGELKILKVFSKTRDKQVLGGKVLSGFLKTGLRAKIVRRENEIGEGKILELQAQKVKTSEVTEGNECGLMIESRVEIAEGDRIKPYTIVIR